MWNWSQEGKRDGESHSASARVILQMIRSFIIKISTYKLFSIAQRFIALKMFRIVDDHVLVGWVWSWMSQGVTQRPGASLPGLVHTFMNELPANKVNKVDNLTLQFKWCYIHWNWWKQYWHIGMTFSFNNFSKHKVTVSAILYLCE